jgi:isoamylase
MLMIGRRLAERDERGAPLADDDLLLLLNAHHEAIDFQLPDAGWTVLLDTARVDAPPVTQTYPLEARSLALLAKASR